jgi:hypothetical protein
MPNAAQRDLIAGCAGVDTEPPNPRRHCDARDVPRSNGVPPRKTTINSRFSNVNCVTSHAQIMLRVAGLIIRQGGRHQAGRLRCAIRRDAG